MKNKLIAKLFHCFIATSPPPSPKRRGSNRAIEQLSNRKSQKGFTIVELLLYMGILSVLLSILVAIFVSALDAQLESASTSSIERDGTYILAKLAYDVHRASSVSIPSTLGGSGSSLKIVVGGVNYTYTVDAGGNLTLYNNSSGTTDNLNSFDSKVSASPAFTVTRLGNAGGVEDTLKINFTLQSRTLRPRIGYETKAFETDLSLRRQ